MKPHSESAAQVRADRDYWMREAKRLEIAYDKQADDYAAGYYAGVQAVWDKWVCSACGFNHDEDESAACEGADVISFADWYGRASDFLRSIREWRGLT